MRTSMLIIFIKEPRFKNLLERRYLQKLNMEFNRKSDLTKIENFLAQFATIVHIDKLSKFLTQL